jgi:monoterpene epsilon-lactone hydrolase
MRAKKSRGEKESIWKKLNQGNKMNSFKSRLIINLLRNRHLFQGRLRKETWDMNTSVVRFREMCEDGAKKSGNLPDGIEVSPVTIDGLAAGQNAEWVRPAGVKMDTAIFYTHGGGYISGTCSDHRNFIAKIAKRCDLPVLHFDHRLAPEHPYPAALEDALTAYRWLLNTGIAPARIVMVGESAGGGLCLATLLAVRDQSLPLPSAAVVMSPWTDLMVTGESHRTKANVCLSPFNMAVVCSKHYAGNHDRTDPYISPLYGDLHGLPPLFISVGDDETMRDDSVRFADKAIASGVDTTLRIGEGMVHCYPLMAPAFPEATQALDEICEFIKHHARLVKEHVSSSQAALENVAAL